MGLEGQGRSSLQRKEIVLNVDAVFVREQHLSQCTLSDLGSPRTGVCFSQSVQISARAELAPSLRLGALRVAGLASFTLSTCSRWHGVYANTPSGKSGGSVVSRSGRPNACGHGMRWGWG